MHLKGVVLLKIKAYSYRVTGTQSIYTLQYVKRSSVAKNEGFFLESDQDSKHLKGVVLLKMNAFSYRMNKIQSI